MKVLALALAHALIVRQWSLARSSHASLVTNSKSLLSTPQLFVPTDGSLFAYSLKSNPTSFWLLGRDPQDQVLKDKMAESDERLVRNSCECKFRVSAPQLCPPHLRRSLLYGHNSESSTRNVIWDEETQNLRYNPCESMPAQPKFHVLLTSGDYPILGTRSAGPRV